jgi:hypothetical protein
MGLIISWLTVFFYFSDTPQESRAPDAVPASLRNSSEYTSSSGDTLVNYCLLIHAGYTYGQEYAHRKRTVSEGFVTRFNTQWKDGFNVQSYQQGISATEFTAGSRFSEGNEDAFPPSSLYPMQSPDTYMTFHLAKEIGMIQSPGFADCPSCIQQSIAKVGAYLSVTPLRDMLCENWPYLKSVPRVKTSEEVDTVWRHLQCLFPNIHVDPKGLSPLRIRAPEIQFQDTLKVKSVHEIKATYEMSWPGCGVAGNSLATPPLLVSGKAGKRNAVYRVTISSDSGCNTSGHWYQYFVLK